MWYRPDAGPGRGREDSSVHTGLLRVPDDGCQRGGAAGSEGVARPRVRARGHRAPRGRTVPAAGVRGSTLGGATENTPCATTPGCPVRHRSTEECHALQTPPPLLAILAVLAAEAACHQGKAHQPHPAASRTPSSGARTWRPSHARRPVPGGGRRGVRAWPPHRPHPDGKPARFGRSSTRTNWASLQRASCRPRACPRTSPRPTSAASGAPPASPLAAAPSRAAAPSTSARRETRPTW